MLRSADFVTAVAAQALRLRRSRRGYETQVLAIGPGRLSGQLLIGSQHRAQGIEDVLSSFLAGAALAHCPRNLQNARDDPALLVGAVRRS